MAISDLRKMSCGAVCVSALISVSLFASLGDCRPRPYYRWYDYDFFAPQAKPVQDSGTGQVLSTVNPLRPYEPWVLDCNLLFADKIKVLEPGKRHPRCKEVDETNEKEYANFLLHVRQWEDAYPDRAERWNTRFPDAKENEKKRYEQLKAFADSHQQNNVEAVAEELGSSTNTASQRTKCTNNANCSSSTTSQSRQLRESSTQAIKTPSSE